MSMVSWARSGSSPGPTPPTSCASLKLSMLTRPTGPSAWSGPVHKNMVILKLEGVTDVNGALAMRNAVLYIDRKDANLPEGSFFLADS